MARIGPVFAVHRACLLIGKYEFFCKRDIDCIILAGLMVVGAG